ncbi:MAG: hypothetical protein FJZ95_08885, partial [Chloroflexi bacterium]|nr:hypothetical protein [Chloroflexota bacterium]
MFRKVYLMLVALILVTALVPLIAGCDSKETGSASPSSDAEAPPVFEILFLHWTDEKPVTYVTRQPGETVQLPHMQLKFENPDSMGHVYSIEVYAGDTLLYKPYAAESVSPGSFTLFSWDLQIPPAMPDGTYPVNFWIYDGKPSAGRKLIHEMTTGLSFSV